MDLLRLLFMYLSIWCSSSFGQNITDGTRGTLLKLLNQKSLNKTVDIKELIEQSEKSTTTKSSSIIPDIPKIIELQPLVFDAVAKEEILNQNPKIQQLKEDKVPTKKNENQNVKKYKSETADSGKSIPAGDLFIKRKSKLLSLDKVKKVPSNFPKFSTRKPMIEYANMAKIPLLEVRRTTLKNDTISEIRSSVNATINKENNNTTGITLGEVIQGVATNKNNQKPFFYEFTPNENPIRSELKETRNISQTPSTNNKFYNINDLPNVKNKPNKYFDDLQTSESRQRSKIEIKEVNGTLYEYEYIYYYDDDYPSYDYDTPVITDYDTKSNLVSENNEITANKQNVITDNALSSDRAGTLAKDSRAVLAKDNEILPKNEINIDRSQNKQNSRGRALSTDNANVENSLHEINIEHLKLPDHTRFPPRELTTPISNFEPTLLGNDKTISESLLDQNNVGVFDTTTVVNEDSTDKAIIDLYALSRAADANFVESTTLQTVEEEPTSTIDYDALYDYDFSLSELEGIDLESNTEIPTTFQPPTTIAITTTTTSTTIAPTPKKTSLTKSGRTRGSSRLKSGASRFSRIRGLNRRGEDNEQPANAIESTESTPLTTTAKEPRNSLKKFARPSLRGRNRLRGKPNAPKKFEEEENVKLTTTEKTNEESTTKSSQRKPLSRSRFSRPRTNLRSRGRPSPRTEEQTTLVNEEVPETTTEKEVTTKAQVTSNDSRRDRLAKTRFRRPPSSRSSLLGRFNRNRNVEKPKPVVKEEEISEITKDSSDTAVAETENPIEINEPEKLPVTEAAPVNPRGNFKRRHRFNIPKRNKPSNDRFKRPVNVEEKITVEETVAEQTTQETLTTAKPIEITEETTKTSRRSFKRFGSRRDKTNLNHRFRTRGLTSDNKINELTEENQEDSTKPNSTTQNKEDTQSTTVKAKTVSDTPRTVNTRPSRNRSFRRNSSNRRRVPPIFERKPEVVSPKESHDLADKSETKPTQPETVTEEETVKPEPEPEPIPTEEPTQDEAKDEASSQNTLENTTTEPSTEKSTTEKLTRRQILAQRRANFLRNG